MAQLDDLQTLINLELPRRCILLTVATTGYDGDPNDGGAPTIIQLAPIGTWFRESTASVWWCKAEAAWGIQDAAENTIDGGSYG